jgi:hypothetical protein
MSVSSGLAGHERKMKNEDLTPWGQVFIFDSAEKPPVSFGTEKATVKKLAPLG